MLIALKVLSSEVDQAKRGLIRKLFIKERGAEISANFGRPHSCESPLKFRVPTCMKLKKATLCASLHGIRIPIANSCMSWRCSFEELSQDGGLADFSKKSLPSLFNK
jgi:hypothetical protein